MKKQIFSNFLACLLLVLLMLSCSAPQPPAANSEADKAALLQADLDWSKTAEAADWSDSTGFYSYLLDDAVYLPPNEPAWNGKAAVKEKLGPYFSMPGFSAKWEPSQAVVSGDLGYTIGNYDMLMKDSTGATNVVENGKYLVVWKRQADGKWKVAAESFNPNTPPPAAGN